MKKSHESSQRLASCMQIDYTLQSYPPRATNRQENSKDSPPRQTFKKTATCLNLPASQMGRNISSESGLSLIWEPIWMPHIPKREWMRKGRGEKKDTSKIRPAETTRLKPSDTHINNNYSNSKYLPRCICRNKQAPAIEEWRAEQRINREMIWSQGGYESYDTWAANKLKNASIHPTIPFSLILLISSTASSGACIGTDPSPTNLVGYLAQMSMISSFSIWHRSKQSAGLAQ